MLIKLRYEIAMALSQRNAYVSNGDNGTPDRRAVTSQTAVTVEQNGAGLDITVPFIALTDLTNTSNRVTISLGV